MIFAKLSFIPLVYVYVIKPLFRKAKKTSVLYQLQHARNA